MNFKKKPIAALILASVFSASPVSATLVDTGSVNPSNSADQVNYNGTMTVGPYGNGTFEVNTSSVGNGLTAASNQGMRIGGSYLGESNTGTVRVIGDGTHGSARIDIGSVEQKKRLDVGGFGGTGILNISNGGIVDAHAGTIRTGQNNSVAEINIDGIGSELRTDIESAGFGGGIIITNTSTVNISNGGAMRAIGGSSFIFVDGGGSNGSDAGETSTINVFGGEAETEIVADAGIGIGSRASQGNSYLNLNDGGIAHAGTSLRVSAYSGEAKISADNNSYIDANEIKIGEVGSITGYLADGTPVIQTGSSADTSEIGQQATSHGRLLFYKDGSPVLKALNPSFGDFIIIAAETTLDGNDIYIKATGELVVENSSIVIAQTVNISANGAESEISTEEATTYNNEQSILTVRSGSEIQADVNIYTDGVLNGDGTITGNVLVDGGMIAPGNSPGTLTIDGDLTVLDGIFTLELGFGGESDFINVLGDAIFGPDVIFEILLGDTFVDTQIDLAAIIAANNFSIDAAFDSLNNILLLVSGGSALPANTPISVDFGSGSPALLSTTTQAAGADPVPEPAAILLLAAGLLGGAGVRRKHKGGLALKNY